MMTRLAPRLPQLPQTTLLVSGASPSDDVQTLDEPGQLGFEVQFGKAKSRECGNEPNEDSSNGRSPIRHSVADKALGRPVSSRPAQTAGLARRA